jgi:PEGA domain/WD40-like Beta Propeller Repeat
VLQLARFMHLGSQHKYRSITWRPPRRRSRSNHRIVTSGLVLLCATMTGAVVWIAAGGDFQSFATSLLNWMPFVAGSTYEPPLDGVPVHVATEPTGAEVLVDGGRAGKSPGLLAISHGMHVLTLRHPDALEATETIDVATDPIDLTIPLWSRKPQVAPLRPNYPGASLLDARWLADGQVILAVGVGQRATGATARELWRLDPKSGQMQRVLPPAGTEPSILTLSPDGKRLAYVASTSASGLPQEKAGNSLANAGATSESVMIAEQGGPRAPESTFELPVASPGLTTSERITDLVWTPDSQHLVAITRVGDSRGRSRIILLEVPALQDPPASPSSQGQLALLPAEIVPASASVDPGSRWFAAIAHAANAPGGRDVVSLFAVELRPGGAVRDLADLGSSDRIPAAAPVAWAPTDAMQPSARLLFAAPVPAAANNSPGILDLFSALRAAVPPAGLFVTDLSPSNLQGTQSRRVGTAINLIAPLWRADGTSLAFGRPLDALAFREVDLGGGTVRDLAVQLPAGVGQGSGTAARWDEEHRRLLLLNHPSTTSSSGSGSPPLQAWLVSFAFDSSPARP